MGMIRKPLVNAAQRYLGDMFPGYFQSLISAKHDFARDFGYPDEITFELAHHMFRRHGIARAACKKTTEKTWKDKPLIVAGQDPSIQEPEELTQAFRRLRFWQAVSRTDLRSLVGGYSGLILRIADDKLFHEPVEVGASGLDDLVEVIPAWAGQLTISEWDEDERSETYGKPKSFQFNEAAVGHHKKPRSFHLHPDRVIIWSEDGSVDARSALEPGYDALLDLIKISGAGGEGFWKNAKSAPVLEVSPEARLSEMAQAMGVAESKLIDAMNEQVEDWQKGFDQLLMLQGIEAKTLGITLPSPEHFFAISLQVFAASFSIPLKILVGSQTGERASTEDANEWSQTIMSRRENETIPNTEAIFEHLVRIGMIDDEPWSVRWSDLTEAGSSQRMETAKSMTEINRDASQAGDDEIFTRSEVRQAAGHSAEPDDA